MDGCETIEEAKQKIKIFSESQIKSEFSDLEAIQRQREKSRTRVKRYRERQKNKKLQEPDPKCEYCGDDAEELDHLIPVSKGGTDDPENLVHACKRCNRSKNGKDLADFLNMSINDIYLKIDHKMVQNNQKIMNLVYFDGEKYTMK